MALNITYLLGAGASHGALPIVNEMDSAIACQLSWLRKLKEEGKIDLNEAYWSDMNFFAARAKEFGTFDTYARSLHLLEEFEELKLLKLHLSFFFAFELFHENPMFGTTQILYRKTRSIDVRYYGWLATIMGEKSRTPANVRVLSWNYDIQVEFSLSKHLRLAKVPDLYQNDVLGIREDLTAHGKGSADLPFLLHLNGVAGILEDAPGKLRYLFQNINDTRTSEENLQRISQDYAYVTTDRDKFLKRFVNTFSFAWESHSFTNATRTHSLAMMDHTDILVIIGYSFPSFNRDFDLTLLRQFISNGRQHTTKRIVVQSKTMTPETFKHLVRLEADGIPVMIEKELGQFYVPPEFFDRSMSGEPIVPPGVGFISG